MSAAKRARRAAEHEVIGNPDNDKGHAHQRKDDGKQDEPDTSSHAWAACAFLAMAHRARPPGGVSTTDATRDRHGRQTNEMAVQMS